MDETARGNLAAIELLLGQLYLMHLKDNPNAQEWVANNLQDLSLKIIGSELPNDEKAAAQGTLRRVMQMTAWLLESSGNGKPFEVQ